MLILKELKKKKKYEGKRNRQKYVKNLILLTICGYELKTTKKSTSILSKNNSSFFLVIYFY